MHSIAIFGDVRTHFVEGRSTSRSPKTGEEIITPIRGSFKSGVPMTNTAIVRALQAIERAELPKVFSYETRDFPVGDATPIGDYRSWDLTSVPINGLGKTRSVQRLRPSGSTPKFYDYPTLSPEFLGALYPNGLFEPSTIDKKLAQFQVPDCPDIAVFHDLGIFFRTLTVSGGPSEPEVELKKLAPNKAPDRMALHPVWQGFTKRGYR